MKLKNVSKVVVGLFFIFSFHNVHASESAVSFYGLLDVYGGVSKDAGNELKDHSIVINSNGMTTSFIGAKTKVDLQEGLSGVAKLETFLRPDSGDEGRFAGDSFYGRNAFIGLEGKYGSLTVGRNTMPFFISTIMTNPFGAAFGFGPIIKHSYLGGLQGDSSWGSSVQFNSSTFRGFNGSLIYSSGERSGETDKDKMGFNVFYKKEKIEGTFAYQSIDTITENKNSPLNANQLAGLVGISYSASNAKLFGQYQIMHNSELNVDVDYNTLQLGATIPIGNSSILASYANTKTSTSPSIKRNTYALGYDHVFSKAVDLYTVFYLDDKSNKGTAIVLAMGGRVKF